MLKAIIKERTSYCLQFDNCTESIKILNFIKMYQSSEQSIIDLSEWRESERTGIREFRKELAMSKTLSIKKYGFSYDSNKNCFDKIADLE